MKHVSVNSAFEFSTEPFAAFRYDLIDDLGERHREFLPVQGILPVATFSVTTSDGTLLYEGTDEDVAQAVTEQYNHNPFRTGFVTVASVPILPEGAFRLICVDGTVVVVPGADTTDRCLLFVGCYAGFGRSQSLLEEGTTGRIVKHCAPDEEYRLSIEAIALLEVGQTVAFRITESEVHLYTWTGEQVGWKCFSWAEWVYYRTAFTAFTGDAEPI